MGAAEAMNRDTIQKLLGGYATGTLTPEEQQALFAAALEDQELFDALGREQAMRDLLRDPSAKAELLAALDAPAERGGWWAWLHRPMVAGFAVAGVVAIATVAVWQTMRLRPVAPVTVAELKVQEPQALPAAPEAKVTEVPRSAPLKRKAEIAALRDASGGQALVKKDIAPAVNAPAAAPPPTPLPAATPAPVSVGSTTQTVEVTAAAPVTQATPAKPSAMQVMDQVTAEKLKFDARSLFYGNSLVRSENGLMPSFAAGSGGAQPIPPKVASTSMRAATAALSLGVRVSLLRGAEEAAVTTVLNPGESVRLRLTPNEDGFLYVAARDGGVWKMVASGPAQRLKPFETPALAFAGSGQQQLYVMLSRTAQTLSPQALAGKARANLVETAAEQDRATYVVANSQSGAPQQVVQPITLTYR